MAALNLHNLRKYIGVIILSAVFCISMYADNVIEIPYDTVAYNDMAVLPSDYLVKMASENMAKDTLSEATITALTVVANRYYDDRHRSEELKQIGTAMRNLGLIFMTKPINYSKSYKYLMLARHIAEEQKDYSELSYIYISLASLFHNSWHNDDLSPESRQYMIEGFKTALKANNQEALLTIAFNMATVAFNEESWGDFKLQIDKINCIKFNPNLKNNVRFLNDIIDATQSYLMKDYPQAKRKLEEALSLLPDSFQGSLYRYQINESFLGHLYKTTGDYDKAIDVYKAGLKYAEDCDLPKYQISSCLNLSEIYDKKGTNDSSEYYYVKFLKLYANLEKRNGYGNVEKLQFITKLDMINDQVEELTLKRQEERRQRTIIVSILVIVISICLSLLWVYFNLKKSHKILFKRNEEIIKREAHHNLLKENLEKELGRISVELDQTKSELSKYRNETPDDSSIANTEKSKSSDNTYSLTQDDLKEIFAKVLAVMETSRDIYNIGFSINDLSALVNINPKFVSKAINVCYGNNFNQLLNEYRIREVTKLMREVDIDNYTIEGLAMSAGFKSRTSFANLFKKITGLTPTEYIAMAKNEKKNPS